MTVDFSQLLSKPLDEVKRPPPLPAGTFYATVKNYEPGESKNKKTPFIRFNFTLTGPGPEHSAEDMQGVDLSKKALFRDYYLTPDADWRLKDFLSSMGIDTAGRTFASTLPESINQPVILDVAQRPNPEKPTDPPFNDVKDCKGHRV